MKIYFYNLLINFNRSYIKLTAQQQKMSLTFMLRCVYELTRVNEVLEDK